MVLPPRSWLVAALTSPDDGVLPAIRAWGNCLIFTGRRHGAAAGTGAGQTRLACGNPSAHDEDMAAGLMRAARSVADLTGPDRHTAQTGPTR
jgi:hypothetical protein